MANYERKHVTDSRIPARRVVNKPRPYSEVPGKSEQFFPNFLLKEWMVAVVFLFGFMILVTLKPAPLEEVADPTASGYIPLPDWYFLFLYQLLKYFPGKLEIVATVIIPGFFATLFLLAPWLDRKPERRPSKRPIATGLMLIVIVSLVFLTWQSVVQHNELIAEQQAAEDTPAPGGDGGAVAGDTDGKTADVEFDAAGAYANSCGTCHGAELQGGYGPTLVGLTLSADEIVDIINNGQGNMPPGTYNGSDEEKTALAEWILDHK